MAAHFYPLAVKEIKPETPGCVSILFDVPAHLHDVFAYTQGQHLTLRTTVNGNEIRRNYSLCSSPLNNEWRIAVKQVEGGLFSTHANSRIKVGDTIDVMPPLGKFFTPLNSANKKHYLAIAAGSGITPVISIIETTLRTEPASRFTLVYANRHYHNIIFKERIESLKDRYLHRFGVHFIFSGEQTEAALYSGRLDKAKCEVLFSKIIPLATIDEVFVCGPLGMIETVKEYMQVAGFEKERIHSELFAGNKLTPLKMTPAAVAQQEEEATVEIKLDGRTFSFLLAPDGTSILDAALQQGADLPYACKGGVCTTCRAKLAEGKVHMDANYGLDEKELEAGFILACQSHPLTRKIVVDFDQQ